MAGVRAMIDDIIGEEGYNQEDQGSRQHRDENEVRTDGALNADEGGGAGRRMIRAGQVHDENGQSHPDGHCKGGGTDEGDHEGCHPGRDQMATDEVAGLCEG